MRKALKQGEFRVYYQPIISLETDRISEVEALVRWEHPQRGLLSPDEFIPLAEETGLILPLGQWVLEESCRQVSLWRERHPTAPPLVSSVNLSARQLERPDLIADIAQTLRENTLKPDTLRLEITESVAIEDMESAAAMLQALRGLGVQLAIDDFGTGYSSLSYLKHLPVDAVKIDRSFVQGLGLDPEYTSIVRAVIAVAKSIGLNVTGEGIETTEQLTQLRALSCDLGQGYYFAKPMPINSIDSICTLLKAS